MMAADRNTTDDFQIIMIAPTKMIFEKRIECCLVHIPVELLSKKSVK